MPLEAHVPTVLQCLRDNYGLSGHLERIAGENLNFLFTVTDEQKFVVKIVSDDVPPEVVEMELAAIEHAQAAEFGLELPKITYNKFGNIETRIEIHKNALYRLRLIDFIAGKSLQNLSDISINLTKNVGFYLAEYHLAMKDFDHPAAQRNHRWNLAEAGQHKGKTGLLKDPVKRALLAWGFDSWSGVKPVLDSLPRQFIHGDPNPENILVEGGRLKGLVDFGDACFNPAVCDLAICATYLMMGRPDPFGTMGYLLEGYREIRPLSDTETGTLLPLVHGRLATSIAISIERRGIDPNNPNWFSSEEPAWSLLTLLKSRAGEGPLAGPAAGARARAP
jgi:Ser/Thr protein kinase RdoA (MazF antagonist)